MMTSGAEICYVTSCFSNSYPNIFLLVVLFMQHTIVFHYLGLFIFLVVMWDGGDVEIKHFVADVDCVILCINVT